MAKRRNDARSPATPAKSATRADDEKAKADSRSVATPATRGKRRWIDEGGDELSRWGYWDEDEPNSYAVFEAIGNADFWQEINKQAEECDRILTEHGFPRTAQRIRYDDDGDWWDESDPAAPEIVVNGGGGRALGWAFAKRKSEPFSDGWYAAFIGGEIWMILKDKSASHEWQLQRILQIGALAADWKWRRNYKPLILDGKKANAKYRKAGAGGAKTSRKAQEARLAALMNEIESVSRRNPDVVYLGEQALAKLALSCAIRAQPDLWKQGKGQLMEYIGKIRRGEAGDEIQKRYLAVFGGKLPRLWTHSQ